MRITDQVYLVGGGGFGYSAPGDCNVYLVDGGSALALIDTGGGSGAEDILCNVKRMGFDPSMITVAFNTHCHFDHIGGNCDIKEATGCKIAAHEKDRRSIMELDEKSLYSMAQERGLSFRAAEVDVTLKDGDKFPLGEVTLEVIHTPGHTPGCVSLLMRERDGKLGLFCGDVAGASGRLGYINGLGFDLADWKRSIRRMLGLKPDRLYPGHNTFLLGDAVEHLRLYDQKMNAAWTTIVTSVG
ncbi:MBL fold metallo-hydrolase [Candidatus Bathyarchaeota archaeon]|nr:MBL fold metallo-hydrolase [Candidatus Bathyarchaeota archaeon]